MKLNSKYFDSIRIAPKGEAPRPRAGRGCQWKGCRESAQHRAPKGRGRDGEYFHFCLDHVRQFNATYNYFNGMSDAEVEDFQKDAVTGHRPTWRLGEKAAASGREPPDADHTYARFARKGADPHELLGDTDAGGKAKASEPRRALRPLERRALDALHLPEQASREEIKARFKELVKRHHPDANGGDRASEDKLREIIQAYNYLKQAGLV